MKNWKTTLVGAIAAVGLCVFQMIQTGNVDPKTLITAAAIGLGLYLAKDKDLPIPPIIQQAIPLVGTILTAESNAHPTNAVLQEIKGIVNGIASNLAQPAQPLAEVTPKPDGLTVVS
jgi:hypothetical protein